MAALALHHVTSGSVGGPPVCLVHGLASNLRLWDGVAERLADAGHHVVACDLRGHGRSPKPEAGEEGAYALSVVAADVAALLEHAFGGRPAVLAGQSYGGNVVLRVAADAPGLVGAVAAVDGGFLDLRQRFPRWEDCARELAPPPLVGRPLVEVEGWVRQAQAGWPEASVAGQLANLEVRGDGTVAPWLTRDRHLAVLHGLWASDPGSAWPRVRQPVLLLAADQPDAPAWTASKHEDVARCAAALGSDDVRVEWMVGAHDLHAQHPAEVAALLAGLAARPS